MPLYLAEKDRELSIHRITGTDRVRQRLESMGFTVGEQLRVVSQVDQNIIVKIKGISVALSYELAKRIHV